jgi:hypothetical protein
MTLPEPLEDDYHRTIQAIEEAEQMRYVTTAERIGMRKGMERGMERGLEWVYPLKGLADDANSTHGWPARCAIWR